MAKFSRVRGSTSNIFEIFAQNAGATNGSGLTGLVFNSASLTAYYKYDNGSAATAITLANITTIGTFANNGFREVDSTNMPGLYEFDPPNAAFSNTTAKSVTFMLKGATNLAPVVFEVDLIGVDPQNATTMGIGALPNATPGNASGGLHILGTNNQAVTYSAGMTISNADGDALALTSSGSNGNGLNASGNGSGNGVLSTGGATGHGISGVGGATSGNGIKAVGTAGNSVALNLVGQGSAAGLLSTGGATGHGISAVGGATSGDGISSAASTSGHGITATGVGTTKHGINATGGSTTSHGISATGGGVGHGILATSGTGATGDGIRGVSAATDGNGLNLVGNGTGDGLLATGGAGAGGDGIQATAGGGVPIRGDITANITGNLSGSVGSVTGAVGSVTGAVGSVTGNVGGNVAGTVGSVVGDVGGDVLGSVAGNVDGSVTGNVGGNVAGSVGSVTASVTITAGQILIKKNTQYSNFKFVMTDSTNHNPATGLTVSATRAIDNGSFASCANSVSEVSDGWYKITLAAADLNGTDIALRFTATGADDKNFKITTQT